MVPAVLLVRHTEIARHWQGRCYGRLDVGLSRVGAQAAKLLARQLAAEKYSRVIYSGARRTRAIAWPLARLIGVDAECDPRWLERDFGTWEGRTWGAIYRETGSAMDGMIGDPRNFRPGGGETTFELRDRVTLAWNERVGLPAIIITHGGPIAALCGAMRGLSVSDWLAESIAYGSVIRMPLSQ